MKTQNSYYRVVPNKNKNPKARQFVWTYNHQKDRAEVWSTMSERYVRVHIPNVETLTFQEISQLLCPDLVEVNCIDEETAEKVINTLYNLYNCTDEEKTNKEQENSDWIAEMNGAGA